MKKVKMLLLLVISGALLFACSASGGEDTSAESPETTEPGAEAPDAPAADMTNLYRPESETLFNIEYIEDGLISQRLDLYLPAAASPEDTFPIVMMIHQGGADKNQAALTSLAEALVEQDFAVISINHRQQPQFTFPANVSDAICALGWIYQNAAKYGFDTGHIFLLGYSSGATMAAFMASVDSYDAYTENCVGAIPEDAALAGVITFTGIYDYPAMAEGDEMVAEYIAEVMGGTYVEVPDVWQEASPITWVDGSEPEFLILHGANDRSIPPAQSTAFFEKLEAAGGSGTLYIMPGLGHQSLITAETAKQYLMDFLFEKIGQ